MFGKILIANRGEIAVRVIKTCRRMGIKTVVVYSDADAGSKAVEMADEAVHIGGSPAAESYLVMDKIIDAVKQTGAEAVHPGFGFLSENPAFAKRLEDENIAFIGPNANAIEAMGDKISSKKLAAEAGVSTVPGHMGLITDTAEAIQVSRDMAGKASASLIMTRMSTRVSRQLRPKPLRHLATTGFLSRNLSCNRGISRFR